MSRGQIVEAGPGLRRFKTGDRVIVYHISGCGVCHDCRMGYMISCSSPLRAAYGWQRDGGMAPYILADEKDLVALPDPLSYTDGAQVACGFGTVYEALEKIGVCGTDAVLVVGLGPVGLAALMLARAMGAHLLVGVEMQKERVELAKTLGLAHAVIEPGPGRPGAVEGADRRTRVRKGGGLLGKRRRTGARNPRSPPVGQDCPGRRGGNGLLQPEPGHHPRPEDHLRFLGHVDLAHGRPRGAARPLGIHPESLVTHRFPLEKADDAYRLMASGACGKVAVAFDEEVRKEKVQ